MAQFGVGCPQLLTCRQSEITARGSLRKTARLPNSLLLSDSNERSSKKSNIPPNQPHQVHPLDFEQDLYLAKLIERKASSASLSPGMQRRAQSQAPLPRVKPLEAGCTPAKSGPTARVSCVSSSTGHTVHVRFTGRDLRSRNGTRRSHTRPYRGSQRKPYRGPLALAAAIQNATSETAAMHRGNCPEHQLRQTTRAVQAARGCSHRGSCRLPSFPRKVTHIEQRSIGRNQRKRLPPRANSGWERDGRLFVFS